MKSDSKAIFTAAAKASQAVEYLIGLQPTEPDTATYSGPIQAPVIDLR